MVNTEGFASLASQIITGNFGPGSTPGDNGHDYSVGDVAGATFVAVNAQAGGFDARTQFIRAEAFGRPGATTFDDVYQGSGLRGHSVNAPTTPTLIASTSFTYMKNPSISRALPAANCKKRLLFSRQRWIRLSL